MAKRGAKTGSHQRSHYRMVGKKGSSSRRAVSAGGAKSTYKKK